MRSAQNEQLSGTNGANLVSIPIKGNSQNENPTGDPATLAATAQALIEDYDDAAYFDTRLRGDINSIKNHCNRSLADVVAVVNGNWSSDTTWYNANTGTQVKPAAGDKVLVPPGITVTYDQNDDTEYDWVRVDGEFRYDVSADRKIVLDTFFIDHTGVYRIATEGAPVPADNTITIEYADNGDLDVTNDPVKMQRGFVCFGRSFIYGAPKAQHRRMAAGLDAGATKVTLDGTASGWRVGDEILITPTRYKNFVGNNWTTPESETRIIDSIDTANPTAPVISWTGGLTYPHPACHLNGDLRGYVANLTRNVRTYTAGNPLNKHRAHQLFKNKDANAVQYMEARTMGRTDMDDKNGRTPVSLRAIMNNGMLVPDTGLPIDADTNHSGRYTWHFHRNGPDDPTLDPTIFLGLVGVDCPGWMFVHHDSHGFMRECVAYDFQAVGFAGEGGGSFGALEDCLACHQREPVKQYSNASTKDGGNKIGDLGHGFWSNSRILHVKRCVACGVQNGISWTTRVSFFTNVFPGVTQEIRPFYGLASLPDTDVIKAFAVLEGFEDNESYACYMGGSVAKKQGNQGHNLRSVFDGYTSWETSVGFHVQYTAEYTFLRFRHYAFDPSHRGGQAQEGMSIFRLTSMMTLMQPHAEGFKRALSFSKASGYNFDSNWKNIVVAPSYVNNIDNYYITGNAVEISEPITLPFSRQDNGVIDVVELPLSAFGPGGAGTITASYPEDDCVWDGSGNFVIHEGFTLTDSLGTHTRYAGRPSAELGIGDRVESQAEAVDAAKVGSSHGHLTLIERQQMELMMKQEGVYTNNAGDKVLLIPDIAGDRGDGTITYFYTPVAIRISASYYSYIAPSELGNLDTLMPEFAGFNPAGTPGLT